MGASAMGYGSVEAGRFVALFPLASWLAGFDRYSGRYSKANLPRSKYPGVLYMMRAGEDLGRALSKSQDLARRLGDPSGAVAWIESELPVGPGAMEPNRWTGTGVGWRWPSPEVAVARCGVVAAGELAELSREDLTARAFESARGAGALDWASCAPRTLSALPIAMACQARCAFCFSKASASEAARQRPMDLGLARAWAKAARSAGARRAVVTGGGEPTLCAPAALEDLCRALSEEVGPTLIITNGARWSRLGDAELASRLDALADAGLARVALSRHGVGREAEARIMGIDAGAERVAAALRANGRIKSRSICVLQRGGVDSAAGVVQYLSEMARQGVAEVCFKELYVSSLSENPWAPSPENAFAAERQVPLSMVLEALDGLGFERSGELPWGAPLLRGRVGAVEMSVAAYTEPSVGWEIAHKTVRSWNLMADGSCLASLEDPRSALSLPEPGA